MALWPQFGYRSLWVRLIACLLTANVVWYALGARAMETMEELVYEMLLETRFLGLPDVPTSVEVALVFLLCLAPAFFRLERPLHLFVCSAFIALCYAAAFALGLLLEQVILPVAGPFLGLIGSTAVLETMAWSAEHFRRRELERMERARQEFTDMLVHDLKNRIASMSMSFSVLEKELPEPSPRTEKLLNTIRSSSDRMLLQVNALLDIRKIQEEKLTLRPATLSLSQLLNQTLGEYAAATDLVGVSVHNTITETTGPTVCVDRDLFSRILSNLLWNALKHAPRGSRVDIGCEQAADGEVHIHVANRGRPIPSDALAAIFSPFVAGPNHGEHSEERGTGLGLTFCKLAIEAHGGRIRLESPWQEHGDGVCVTLSLPTA